MRWKQKDTESSLNKSKVNNMWKPPAIDFREEHRLLKGIDGIIRETWPHLEMYYTMWGWIRETKV